MCATRAASSAAVLCVSILTILTYPVGGQAQDNVLSLREAIAETLEQNPRFDAFQFRREALEGERQTASMTPAPRLSGQIENALGSAELNGLDAAEFTLAISQVIELGDKRGLRGDVVSRRQTLLTAERQVLELELIAETTRRFIELVAAQERLARLVEATEVASQILASIDRRVAAGRSSQIERQSAATALRRAELQEQSEHMTIEALKVRLSSQWGNLVPAFDRAAGDLMRLAAAPTLEELLFSLAESPAVLIYADEARLRQAELRATLNTRRADIELGAGIRHLSEIGATGFVFEASLPLFAERRAAGSITSANANLALVDAEREAAMLRLGAGLSELDLQHRKAANQFQVIRDEIVPDLTSILDLVRNGFDEGRYSFLELSAARDELLEARFQLIDAATRIHLLTAEIEFLSGRSFTEFSNGVAQ